MHANQAHAKQSNAKQERAKHDHAKHDLVKQDYAKQEHAKQDTRIVLKFFYPPVVVQKVPVNFYRGYLSEKLYPGAVQRHAHSAILGDDDSALVY